MHASVMIIDDEPDIRLYLMTALEDHGFKALTVAENEAMIPALIKNRPDFILLDIMMPKRSGISIYREIRRHPELNRIPVALMSGIEMTSELDDSRNSGDLKDNRSLPSALFIEKPIRILDLIKRIKQSLGIEES